MKKILTLTVMCVALLSAAIAQGTESTTDAQASIKLGVCNTWALSAILIIKDAKSKGKTTEAVVADLYKQPDPFLLSLIRAGTEAEQNELGSVTNKQGAKRLSDFLTGVCFATINPRPSV